MIFMTFSHKTFSAKANQSSKFTELNFMETTNCILCVK